jgi:hypothetical protein
MSIDEGWHLDAPAPDGDETQPAQDLSSEASVGVPASVGAPDSVGMPLSPVRLEATEAEFADVAWPASQRVRLAPGQPAIEVFEATAEVTGRVRVTGDHAELRFHYQPCDALRCQRPRTFVSRLA